MTTLEWGLLIAGFVMFILSATAVALQRRRYRIAASQTENPGLLPGELSDSLPEDLSAGVVGSLLSVSVGVRDTLIGVVELATRGKLTLRPLIDEDGDQRPYDWVIRLADADATNLPDYQRTLLSVPFGAADGRAPLRQAVTLSGVVMDAKHPLTTASEQLRRDAAGHGWVPSEGAAEFRNVWGCAGGAVLLIGLVGTVVMIIGRIANPTMEGIIGSMLIAVSGALIASLAPLQSHETAQGAELSTEVARHRDFLTHLSADQVDPATAEADFSRWLPAALALDLGDHLGQVFDSVVERSGRWGRPLRCQPAWLNASDLPISNGPLKPSQFVALVSSFVREGSLMSAAGRRPQRTAPGR